MSVEIREVEAGTQRFTDVLRLWRANRRYLGFLPDAGFIDRALKGTLLVATDGEAVLGYLLYDLPRDRVKVVHLCVARDARQGGVARALIEAVSARHRDRRGIELKCRRDFAASKVWPELGFRAVLDVPGRSRARHLLTVWHRAHEHDDLFTVLDEHRELAVIDNNIFQDLISDRPQGRATRNLLDDWVSELVELCVTDEPLARVVVSDPNPSGPVLRAFGDESYAEDEKGRWVCHVRRGIADITESKPAAEEAGIAGPNLAPAAAALERRLWPLKITGGALDTFVISIHRYGRSSCSTRTSPPRHFLVVGSTSGSAASTCTTAPRAGLAASLIQRGSSGM